MKTLTWKVTKNVPISCPDYVPDPYTGEYPSVHCAVYHYETVTNDMSKEFSTLKEIKEFISKAPQNCTEFKVNGKPIKNTRKFPTSNLTITSNLLLTDITSGTTYISI